MIKTFNLLLCESLLAQPSSFHVNCVVTGAAGGNTERVSSSPRRHTHTHTHLAVTRDHLHCLHHVGTAGARVTIILSVMQVGLYQRELNKR